MSGPSEDHWASLRTRARGHRGASSGERAAWEIVRNFSEGRSVDFGDCFARLDGAGKRAVILLLVDIAAGKKGLGDLR